DLKLLVQSVESGVPGEGRKWMVVWGPMHPPLSEVQLTPLGKKMKELRGSAAQFGDYWLTKLAAGTLFDTHAGMLDPARRAKLRPLHLSHLKGAVAAALTAAPGGPRHLLVPTLYQAATLVPGMQDKALAGDTGPVVAPQLRVRGEDRT